MYRAAVEVADALIENGHARVAREGVYRIRGSGDIQAMSAWAKTPGGDSPGVRSRTQMGGSANNARASRVTLTQQRVE